jgi:hypothetical protein
MGALEEDCSVGPTALTNVFVGIAAESLTLAVYAADDCQKVQTASRWPLPVLVKFTTHVTGEPVPLQVKFELF